MAPAPRVKADPAAAVAGLHTVVVVAAAGAAVAVEEARVVAAGVVREGTNSLR